MLSVLTSAQPSARTAFWAMAALCLAGSAIAGAGRAHAANTGAGSAYRIWNDSTGQHQTEGKLLDFEDGKVVLKKKDGTTVTVPLERLSDPDRDYVRQWAAPRQPAPDATTAAPADSLAGRSEDQPQPRGRAVFEFDPSGRRRSKPAVLPQAKAVVVTGVGTDPEKALQNAFSQAIEQTVGVLVDAESVVKNDQLIRDEVLTYSRGYVEKCDIVKQWEDGGSHNTTIRAVVARDKLVAKLREMKIAVQDVAGELAARQIQFDVTNEEQAAEMFKKALAGYDMKKMTKVEIVEKPEIIRDGTNAKLSIKARVSPDLSQWRTFLQELRPLLARTSTRRAGVTSILRDHNLAFDGNRDVLARQLDGRGILVAVLLKTTGAGRANWEVFRVPEAMQGPLGDAAKKRYSLAYVLLDDQGNDISRTSMPLNVPQYSEPLAPIIRSDALGIINGYVNVQYGEPWWLIGPIGLVGQAPLLWFPVYETSSTVQLSQEDLRVCESNAFFWLFR
jgi:hypothetical protein